MGRSGTLAEADRIAVAREQADRGGNYEERVAFSTVKKK